MVDGTVHHSRFPFIGRATARECRDAVEGVLAQVKERKLERLKEELGVLE